MSTTTNRTNRYPGTCSDCGTHVDAEAGILGRKDPRTGRYPVSHKPGECPTIVDVPVTTDSYVPAFPGDRPMAPGEDGGNYAEEMLAMREAWEDSEGHPEFRASILARFPGWADDRSTGPRTGGATPVTTDSAVVIAALREFARSETISAAERAVAERLIGDMDWVIYYP